MCVLCQEEDLYFLYLEQMEREAKAARGETSAPSANWMWPNLAPRETIAPAAAKPAASAFVCDAPDSE
jgi:hypothetical protein